MAARSWETPHLDNYASEVIGDQTKVESPFVTEARKSITMQKTAIKAPILVNGGNVSAVEQERISDYSPITMTPQRQSFVMASRKTGRAEREGSIDSTVGSTLSVFPLGPKHAILKNSRTGSSIADDDSLVNSPCVPNYMASTHSAQAKARSRSLSTPKQRSVTPEREKIMSSSVRKRLSFPTTEESVGSAMSTPKHPRALALTQRSPSLKCYPVSVEVDRSMASFT